METIKKEFTIYKFNELSETAKETAIENTRNNFYENNNFAEWTVDDCSLLEPKDKEIREVYKKNKLEYKDLLIKNNRKIYFSLDRGRYIDISQAMEIQSNYMFLKWLGLNDRLIEKVTFEIGKDTINIEPNYFKDDNITEIEQKKIDKAVSKFEEHCEDILTKIDEDIEYRYSDESISDFLECNDYDFTEDGEIY